jgi:peptidase E
MSMRPPQIVAFGGGGFSMESGNPLLDDYVLQATGVDRPRICFVPTASGDADHYVVRFYRRFSAVADCSHVSLFRRDTGGGAVEGDLEAHLLAQDLIYVGGGSVLSLLGAWRAHGVDTMLKRAWRRGVLLCGLSAGSLCWFSEAITAVTSALPAATALSSSNAASALVATMRASVVLPVPGGPCRIIEKGRPCSMATRSAEPSPRTCSWPTSSARVLGRMRAGSGEPGGSGAGPPPCCWESCAPVENSWSDTAPRVAGAVVVVPRRAQAAWHGRPSWRSVPAR